MNKLRFLSKVGLALVSSNREEVRFGRGERVSGEFGIGVLWVSVEIARDDCDGVLIEAVTAAAASDI